MADSDIEDIELDDEAFIEDDDIMSDHNSVDRIGAEIIRESISGFMVFIIDPDDIEISTAASIQVNKNTKIRDQGSILSVSTFNRLLNASSSNEDMLLAIKKIAEICVKKNAKEIAVLGVQSGQRGMKVRADVSKTNVTNFPSGNQYAHLEKLVEQLVASSVGEKDKGKG